MNRKEALQVLAILKAAYPSSYNNMTREEATGVASVWSMQFADVPADIVLMAVQKMISTSKFPPAISEVRGKIEGLYWDAYSALEADRLYKSLPEERVAQLRRIVKVTERYRFSKMAEPTVSQMLGGGGNDKLLGDGRREV